MAGVTQQCVERAMAVGFFAAELPMSAKRSRTELIGHADAGLKPSLHPRLQCIDPLPGVAFVPTRRHRSCGEKVDDEDDEANNERGAWRVLRSVIGIQRSRRFKVLWWGNGRSDRSVHHESDAGVRKKRMALVLF